MAIDPTFNLEVKFEDLEAAKSFFEDELLPFLENEYEVTDVSYEFGIDAEFELPENGEEVKVEFTRNCTEYLGNLGVWPALVIAYQANCTVEMPHVKRHLEALDEIRDFLIKRKPASDVKYYASTRQI